MLQKIRHFRKSKCLGWFAVIFFALSIFTAVSVSVMFSRSVNADDGGMKKIKTKGACYDLEKETGRPTSLKEEEFEKCFCEEVPDFQEIAYGGPPNAESDSAALRAYNSQLSVYEGQLDRVATCAVGLVYGTTHSQSIMSEADLVRIVNEPQYLRYPLDQDKLDVIMEKLTLNKNTNTDTEEQRQGEAIDEDDLYHGDADSDFVRANAITWIGGRFSYDIGSTEIAKIFPNNKIKYGEEFGGENSYIDKDKYMGTGENSGLKSFQAAVDHAVQNREAIKRAKDKAASEGRTYKGAEDPGFHMLIYAFSDTKQQTSENVHETDVNKKDKVMRVLEKIEKTLNDNNLDTKVIIVNYCRPNFLDGKTDHRYECNGTSSLVNEKMREWADSRAKFQIAEFAGRSNGVGSSLTDYYNNDGSLKKPGQDLYIDAIKDAAKTLFGIKDERDTNDACYGANKALSWFACPLIDSASNFVENMYTDMVEKWLVFEPEILNWQTSEAIDETEIRCTELSAYRIAKDYPDCAAERGLTEEMMQEIINIEEKTPGKRVTWIGDTFAFGRHSTNIYEKLEGMLPGVNYGKNSDGTGEYISSDKTIKQGVDDAIKAINNGQMGDVLVFSFGGLSVSDIGVQEYVNQLQRLDDAINQKGLHATVILTTSCILQRQSNGELKGGKCRDIDHEANEEIIRFAELSMLGGSRVNYSVALYASEAERKANDSTALFDQSGFPLSSNEEPCYENGRFTRDECKERNKTALESGSSLMMKLINEAGSNANSDIYTDLGMKTTLDKQVNEPEISNKMGGCEKYSTLEIAMLSETEKNKCLALTPISQDDLDKAVLIHRNIEKKQAQAGTIKEKGVSGVVFKLWNRFRVLSNVAFIAFLIIVIYAQITGIAMEKYGVRKLVPKIAIVSILVNMSFLICQVALDLGNIFGAGIQDLFVNLSSSIDMRQVEGMATNKTGTMVIVAVIVTVLSVIVVALAAGVAFLIPIISGIVSAAITVMFTYIMLIMRQAMMIMCVIISPLAMACLLLPGTKKLFDRWFKLFRGLIMTYPLASLLTFGSSYTARLIVATWHGSDTISQFLISLLGLFISVVPIIFLPKVTRSSMGAIDAFALRMQNGLSNLSKRGIEKTRVAQNIRHRAAEKKAFRAAGVYRGKDGKLHDITRGHRTKSMDRNLNKALSYQSEHNENDRIRSGDNTAGERKFSEAAVAREMELIKMRNGGDKLTVDQLKREALAGFADGNDAQAQAATRMLMEQDEAGREAVRDILSDPSVDITRNATHQRVAQALAHEVLGNKDIMQQDRRLGKYASELANNPHGLRSFNDYKLNQQDLNWMTRGDNAAKMDRVAMQEIETARNHQLSGFVNANDAFASGVNFTEAENNFRNMMGSSLGKGLAGNRQQIAQRIAGMTPGGPAHSGSTGAPT